MCETGYLLMKLGTSSRELQHFILTRLEFMKNMSRSAGAGAGAGKANQMPVRINLGEKTSLVSSCFFSLVYSFHPEVFFHPHFWQNWVPVPPI